MTRGAKNIIAVSGVIIAALGIVSAVKFSPRLVWNASMSAPMGLYRIEGRAPSLAEFALVSSSGETKKLIEERGYLPQEIPLIKRVSGLSGDEICRENEHIFINKNHVADALFFDSLGRKMPRWDGCFTLQSNDIFLLNDHEKSLDGRYFGLTNSRDVIGVAVPVWVME